MLMKILFLLLFFAMSSAVFAQSSPTVEPGVSQELARWRAARYSDVRYKLNLTLEKMSPVLKGTIEVRVKVSEPPASAGGQPVNGTAPPIILDWRKIKGHEAKSTISNVTLNGAIADDLPLSAIGYREPPKRPTYTEAAEHLIFWEGVAGENVITLDFTSPILPSGSAITRYVDKEDGSEYIYSLFVPSDASTAFPVFDQPDLKARFSLEVDLWSGLGWQVISNSKIGAISSFRTKATPDNKNTSLVMDRRTFAETQPISTYVFAFAAGPFVGFGVDSKSAGNGGHDITMKTAGMELPASRIAASQTTPADSRIYVRSSQTGKFNPHAAEIFRLNTEAVKYFEQYFDYKFPFPKYDLVLIPEFPFGGMEHAGATFLREASIIFPQEPTKNDHISRATLIFHEAAHQWFGDTVTMRWFDDLWLKEGFATFTAYKAMERIMPEMNAWKVFYERIKQGAYQTDSTRGTTAIYQPIANLSAAKSAYGNIVYNKAPAFLRQAEFYLGEDKFQTAVRAFLKKHEFGNAGWEDLVKEFELAGEQKLELWAKNWVTQPGLAIYRAQIERGSRDFSVTMVGIDAGRGTIWPQKIGAYTVDSFNSTLKRRTLGEPWTIHLKSVNGAIRGEGPSVGLDHAKLELQLFFPNYGDYGYGIFLLDEKSRDHVLKNIQNEKDPFLRTMMWGALWDSVREGELDPRVFVELVVKVLGASSRNVTTPSAGQKASGSHPSLEKEGSQEDESTVATLLARTGTALNYYIDDAERVSSPHVSKGSTSSTGRVEPSLTVGLRTRVEEMLIDRMRSAPMLGQRITYYRAFLNIGASERARGVLKDLLRSVPPAVTGGAPLSATKAPPTTVGGTDKSIPLKTKDRFDIVTRLLILGDAEAPKLLAELEKTETSDDAKRYAYAARAGIGTAENKAKYWNDFVLNKEISESWIEAAFGPWNSIRHSELTLPYLERALKELPNHKRNRKIFFVNSWLGAFIGGQRSAEALAVVNRFLADNPGLDNDLRLKILENVDLIERAVRIRTKY
jgi:aminopeptidase N